MTAPGPARVDDLRVGGARTTPPTWDSYVRFRTRAMQRMSALAQLPMVQEPGVVGLLSGADGTRGALLLSGQLPPGRLDGLLDRSAPQWVALLPEAADLAPAVAARGWGHQEERTTMAMTDLRLLTPYPLPDGVRAQPVAVRHGATGYPLDLAIRLAYLYGEARPAPVRELEIEARLLRRLSGIRFFAAVTRDGRCVGTAGSRVVEGSAMVSSVATDPAERRQGIGTAMTAHALAAAAQAGAREAFLEATPVAVGIYRRLGFETIGPVRWCERSAAG